MKYVDLRVITRCDSELAQFLKLCQKIQYLGQIGSSREIKVIVDGDGSGRVNFELLDEKGTPVAIPPLSFEDNNDKEKYLDNLTQYIGE